MNCIYEIVSHVENITKIITITQDNSSVYLCAITNPQTPAAETQAERAQWLIEYAEDAFGHPNFVGWHICGVIDGWNTFGTQKPGVMNALGVVHTNVTDALKNVSLDLYNYRGNP